MANSFKTNSFVGCTNNAKTHFSSCTNKGLDLISKGNGNANTATHGNNSSGTASANSGSIKVIERPLVKKRYSLLDYSIAKTVLSNMGSWSAVGIESGSISGNCLWDASLVQWATDVCLFFDSLFTRARVFYRANKGFRWCDCVALAWKAVSVVKYLTEKLGHVVKEFRPIQAIRSAKHKVRAAARKVSNRMYRELFLVDEPVREFTRLQNGLSLRKYDF